MFLGQPQLETPMVEQQIRFDTTLPSWAACYVYGLGHSGTYLLGCLWDRIYWWVPNFINFSNKFVFRNICTWIQYVFYQNPFLSKTVILSVFPSENPSAIKDYVRRFDGQLVANAFFAIDTFFFLR